MCFDTFFRHVVGISVTDDESGKTEVISGFTMAVGDVWIWVSAGHFLEGVASAQKEYRYQFLDGFTRSATGGQPASLDVGGRWWIYDEGKGIDIGFMFLTEFYSSSMAASGIRPFDFFDWFRQPDEFDYFVLCGIPQELVSDDSVQAIITVVEEIVEPPAILKKECPRFYARIAENVALSTIRGMSGGPIFGVKKIGNETRYWLFALQCGWDPRERVIAACPAKGFGPVFNEAIGESVATLLGVYAAFRGRDLWSVFVVCWR